MDIVNTASDHLNFTYSIKNPYPMNFGYSKDGSYRGLNGAVMYKIVDFNILPIPMNYAVTQVIL